MRYTNTLACNTSIFKAQKPASKIKSFQETTSSMKQLGLIQGFFGQSSFKKFKFLRTDSVLLYAWNFSTFYSSISLLRKLKFSQIDLIYEMKRNISVFQSSNSLLDKL